MARPHRITPEIAARIDAHRGRGIRSKAGLGRALEAEGIRLNWRTLSSYLAGAPAPTAPPRHWQGFATPEPETSAPPALPAPDEGQIRALLEGDELGLADLARHACEIKAALDQWAPRVGTEPVAARTFTTLSRLYTDVVARLTELRPRPEAEADRLESLGVVARQQLIERARAAAKMDNDLHGRLRRQQEIIDAFGG